MNEYIYKLRLIERLHHEDSWTDIDEEILQRHFDHLKKLTEKGTVVLAGRTTVEDAKSLGIVIFVAENDSAAEKIMNSDPAVAEGTMTAVLYPFTIALMKG